MHAPNPPSRPQWTGKQSLLTADNCISGLSSFCRQNSTLVNMTTIAWQFVRESSQLLILSAIWMSNFNCSNCNSLYLWFMHFSVIPVFRISRRIQRRTGSSNVCIMHNPGHFRLTSIELRHFAAFFSIIALFLFYFGVIPVFVLNFTISKCCEKTDDKPEI